MPHTADTLQQAFRYLWPSEVQALKGLAQALPDNPRVVNIGAGAGTSALTFLEARHDLVLITVDIQQGDSPYGCLEAERFILIEAGLEGRFEQFCMDSKVLGRFWQEWGYKPVDMVFVDGDHSLDGCKGDITLWLPNIKPGGIIAIHDYKKEEAYAQPHPEEVPHPKPWPGVDQAVDELLLGKLETLVHVATLIAFRTGAL